MRKIPFSPPDYTEAEINAVAEAMRSGWITTGPRTKQLEQRLAEYCGVNKMVCLASCTAAEEMAFRILGIGAGDEVIVPVYTYTASASAAIHAGASVRFVDSQKDSVEMDYDALEAAISEKTKVIVPVDLGGIVCDYERIFSIVEKKKALFQPANEIQKAIGHVIVLSDCAHALGAERNGKRTGSIADFTVFSFHAVKNFTTAEGGAVCWKDIDGIDNDELYHQFQLYSLHGQSKDAFHKSRPGMWEYDIVAPLYKCNMTDIMAAIGNVQLDRYPSLLKRRKEIIARYDATCDELGLKHLTHDTENMHSSYHLYLMRVPGADTEKRNHIIELFAEKGISCNVHYKPLPMMTAYQNLGFDIKDFPNAYHLFENEITLPLHTLLSDEDVDYITDTMKEIFSSL